MKKACQNCPFVNLAYWSLPSQDAAQEVVDKYINIPEGTPQVCHQFFADHRPDSNSNIPQSEEEVCFGHLEYLKKNGKLQFFKPR